MHNSKIFFAYKGNKCGSCGKSVQETTDRWGDFIGLFDLNHVNPDKKAKNYKNLMKRKKLSTEQIDELDKCVLMCKECHAALHQRNLTIGMEVVLDYGEGLRFKVVLECVQVLFDGQSARLMHFSDELNKLWFCKVRLGTQDLGFASVHDLGDKNFLGLLIDKTRQRGTLLISTLDGEPLVAVERMDETQYKMEWISSFPLIKFDCQLTKKFSFHIRKGAFITDQFVSHCEVTCMAVAPYELNLNNPLVKL